MCVLSRKNIAEFGLQFGSLFGAYLTTEVMQSVDLKTRGVYIVYSSLGGTVYSLFSNACIGRYFLWNYGTTFAVSLIPFLSDSALNEKKYFVPTALLCYAVFQLFKECVRKVSCPDLFEQNLLDEMRQQRSARVRPHPFSRLPISLEEPRSLVFATPSSAPISNSIQQNDADSKVNVSDRGSSDTA